MVICVQDTWEEGAHRWIPVVGYEGARYIGVVILLYLDNRTGPRSKKIDYSFRKFEKLTNAILIKSDSNKR